MLETRNFLFNRQNKSGSLNNLTAKKKWFTEAIRNGNLDILPYLDTESVLLDADLLHACFDKKKSFFVSTKTVRKNRFLILQKLLKLPHWKNKINEIDQNGNRPLHLAVKSGLDGCVKLLLTSGADPFLLDARATSTLVLAAKSGKEKVFKQLLDQHQEYNKKAYANAAPGGGFTSEHISQASQLFQHKLQRRKLKLGVIGAVLAIACPVGSVIAFNELPFLGILLSAFIPTIGPFIALTAALVMGGLLFWATYKKGSLKYGSFAQEKVALKATQAKVDQLKAELNFCTKNQQKYPESLAWREQVSSTRRELEAVLTPIPKVAKREEAKVSDWAEDSDVLKANLTTAGSFMCAFSGVLAILGGASAFFPVLLTLGGVALGVPVAGWIALGVALTVGIGVGILMYKTKFGSNLESFGSARKELHSLKYELSVTKKAIMKDKNLNMSEKIVSPKKISTNLAISNKITETETTKLVFSP